ncbi:MAG: hypothetical protein NZ480_07445 [Bdellovibrionaceae bacterium]|nr:hypothetical protein [Pseudobdellovibrionaceae bacterium]MDW8190875.1 hypothetical protein [Pseudobdellovibrionaceae bacterium]
MHIYLNPNCIKEFEKKGNFSQTLDHLKQLLLQVPGIEHVFPCGQGFPPVSHSFFGPLIDQSCVPGISGHLIIVPKPFWYQQGPPAHHMTHYSYDRFVPLIFWGRAFHKGLLDEPVSMLDVAGTVLYGLGLLPPAQFQGKILFKAFKKHKH